MNFPSIAFWWHLVETVGVEVCALAALGWAAQRAFRRAYWQRAMCQMAIICLLLVSASEWTGFGRSMASFLVGTKGVAKNARASSYIKANPRFVSQLPPPASYGGSAAPRPAVWWPGWVWLAGTVVVLGRMATAQCLWLALRLRREKIVNDSLRERVLSVAKLVGLRRRICLLRMPESISPMAFGVLRPTIGLPPGFESRFRAPEQEAILAHELAHLAAMDPLWFWVADLASALLWWHPLAWWVRRSLHVSSELAADEATALVADGPGSLAKCLVALGKEMTAGRGWGWVGINGGFRSKLGRRVERLMGMSGRPNRPVAGWADAAARIVATILVVPTVVLLDGAIQTAEGESQNGWGEWWNSSPGALLVLAALDSTDKHAEDVARRVQNAKLLYENSEYDESEAILVEVLKDDPANQSAQYYLDMVKEARFMQRAREREVIAKAEAFSGEPPPNPKMAGTNLAYSAVGRRVILSKLDRIRLDEVQYDLPLTEVLNRLRVESQKRDPDGVGINFLINPFPAVAVLADAVAVTAPPAAVDMSTVKIKISPPLTDLRLADVLNAIVMVADQPIKYTVEDYAVVFSPKPAEAETLYSKVFHVDPTVFEQNLRSTIGTNFAAGTSVEGTGFEMDDGHRRADDGHDSFGGPASSAFRIVSPARTNQTVQLDAMVRAYFAAAGANLTVPEKSIFFNERHGLLLVRGTAQDLEIIQQAVATLNQPQQPQVMITANLIEVNEASLKGLALDWSKSSEGGTRIMAETQCRAALAEIKGRSGVDSLAFGKISSLSGHPMRLGANWPDGDVTLEVLPVVRSDGFSIDTTATLTVKAGDHTWHWHIWGFRDVHDGETVVGELSNPPGLATKIWIAFITPRIIDAMGNPVHTDAEISNRH